MSRSAKYHAQPCYRGAIRFDSKKEAARYDELLWLEKAGQVRDIQLQPRYQFGTDSHPVLIRSEGFPKGRRVAYVADFRYFDRQAGEWIVEDVKGFDTPVSRLKRAITEWQYGIVISLV